MRSKNVVTVDVKGITDIDFQKLKKLASQKKSTIESAAKTAVKKFLANGCKLPAFAGKV